MAEINDLDIVDANNTARFPENQAPSTVNDGARALEGLIARWHEDTNGSVASTGSANAYAVAAKQTLSAYYDGLTVAFDANFANTGSATLNVDALGAKTIKYLGTALESGAIVIGQKVWAIYDGTDFQMISPSLVQTLTTLNVDTINEKTTDAGVTADGVILKDSKVTASGGVNAGSSLIETNSQVLSGNQTLTDGATINWDLDAGTWAEVTLGGNRTLAAPTNKRKGGTAILVITQDATGGRTLSYGANFNWPGGLNPVLSTAANAVDIFYFTTDNTTMFGTAVYNYG